MTRTQWKVKKDVVNINSNVGKMKRKWKCDRRLGRNLIHHLQRLNQIVDGLKKEKKKKDYFSPFTLAFIMLACQYADRSRNSHDKELDRNFDLLQAVDEMSEGSVGFIIWEQYVVLPSYTAIPTIVWGKKKLWLAVQFRESIHEKEQSNRKKERKKRVT